MTFSFFEATIILTFQFDEYIHASQNSHLNEFNNHIKKSIQLMITNRLRSTVAKSTNRNVKDIIYSLFFYSSNWLFNRVTLRRVIQRFDKNIVNYKSSFVNFRFRSSSSNSNSYSESPTLKSNRFRSQFSNQLNRQLAFTFVTVISNSLS